MKLTFFVFVFVFLSHSSFSQLVGGELVNEGRKLAEPSDFTLLESTEGVLFYRIAVDRTGKVTSAQLLSDKSKAISIPMEVRVYNYVMELKFEPGTYYPKFHGCEVKINLKKKS